MNKLENILLQMLELLPNLSNKSSYKRFITLNKQISKIIKDNSCFDNSKVDVWEVPNVTWWQNDN